MSQVEVNKKVSAVNDEIAEKSREYLKEKGVSCINIMGSPGSGKTTLIEQLARYIPKDQIAVIQGDLESDIDKQRLEMAGICTFQINTHSGCHLNAKMIAEALPQINLEGRKYLFIENVGNLVCPATKQIGQGINLVVSSTTEGSDKPRKYPIIFMQADILVISKMDLAEAVDFKLESYLQDLRGMNARATILQTSSRNPESFKAVAELLG